MAKRTMRKNSHIRKKLRRRKSRKKNIVYKKYKSKKTRRIRKKNSMKGG